MSPSLSGRFFAAAIDAGGGQAGLDAAAASEGG